MSTDYEATRDFLYTAQITEPLRIGLPRKSLVNGFDQSFVSFGSCFAQNMMQVMTVLGFRFWFNRDICAHYNAETIANVLEWVAERREHTDDDLYFFKSDEIVTYRINMRKRFYGPEARERALSYMRTLDTECRKHITNCDVFVITLGTARVIRLKRNGVAVARGYGIPLSEWTMDLTSVEHTVQQLERIRNTMLLIRNGRPFTMIISVSPQRYAFSDDTLRNSDKQHASDTEYDPFVDSMLNKATLRVAVTEFLRRNDFDPSLVYFPSFELVLEELRLFDTINHYDFLHIDPHHTPEYVVKRFLKAFADDAVLEQLCLHEQLWRKRVAIEDWLAGGMQLTNPQINKAVVELLTRLEAINTHLSRAIIDELFTIRIALAGTASFSTTSEVPTAIERLNCQILKFIDWKKLIDTLDELSAQGEVMLWGLGTDFLLMLEIYPLLAEKIQRPNVKLTDKTKPGTQMFGKDVHPPEQLHSFNGPIIFIPRNRHTRANMFTNAREMGISEHRLIDVYEAGC